MSLSYRRVYELARGTGLSRDAAITATAIAAAESGRNPLAVGDTTITTSKWGPSVGLWQVRSLRAERGTGGTRDESKLRDPAFNARSMHAISGGGLNWTPWSVYTSGAYKSHLAAAREAAGSTSSTEGPRPGATAVDWTDDLGGALLGPLGLPLQRLGPAIGGGALGGTVADATVGEVSDAVTGKLVALGSNLLPYGAALALGIGLVSIGIWKAAL